MELYTHFTVDLSRIPHQGAPHSTRPKGSGCPDIIFFIPIVCKALQPDLECFHPLTFLQRPATDCALEFDHPSNRIYCYGDLSDCLFCYHPNTGYQGVRGLSIPSVRRKQGK